MSLLVPKNILSQDFCFSDVGSQKYSNTSLENIKLVVKVRFTIVRKNNGTGGAPVSRVGEIMSQLHNEFYQYNIHFEQKGNIEYINNTSKYNYTFVQAQADHNLNPHNDAVDIYLYPEHAPYMGAAAACRAGRNTFIFSMGQLRNTGIITSTFAMPHEMGHILGLPHTFGFLSSEQELISGSNCGYAGDRFCDTPASPKNNNGVNFEASQFPNCTWLNPKIEPGTGLTYSPPMFNHMEYTHPSCMMEFTAEQVDAMKAKIEKEPLLKEEVCSGIYGTVNTTSKLYSVNFVSSTSVEADVDAIGASFFSWTRTSGSGVFGTNNDGSEFWLNLNQGGSATFLIDPTSDCDVSAKTVTFVHSGGWYRIEGNPTMDCFEIIAERDKSISVQNGNNSYKTVEISPQIESVVVYNNKGKVIISMNQLYSKQEHLCLNGNEKGIYYIIINQGAYDQSYLKVLLI